MNDSAKKDDLEDIEPQSPATAEEVTKANLIVMGKVEEAVIILEEKNRELPDFNTDEGYALAKANRKEIQGYITRGDKARLAATKYYRDEQKRINAMWNGAKAEAGEAEPEPGIEARLVAIKDKLAAGIKAVDDEDARIAQEIIDKEAKRLEDINKLFEAVAESARIHTMEQCESSLSYLNDLDVDLFQEKQPEGIEAVEVALESVTKLRTTLNVQAAEAKRVEEEAEKQRIEAEKLEKERAELAAEVREMQEFKGEKLAAIWEADFMAELTKMNDALNEENEQVQADDPVILEQKLVIEDPSQVTTGEPFTLVRAPTRSGKGAGLVIKNNRVAVDPQHELQRADEIAVGEWMTILKLALDTLPELKSDKGLVLKGKLLRKIIESITASDDFILPF